MLSDAEIPRLLAIIERRPGQPDHPVAGKKKQGYNAHRERMAKREKEKSKSGRDIGPIPPVEDPERKALCERSLTNYQKNYYPKDFYLEESPDHTRVIALVQSACLFGMVQAVAMPRGFGKSTICQTAAEWSANFGHHLYQMLLAANAQKATEILDIMRMDYETNELLLADFPEICFPIMQLERVANRAKGQTHNGAPTYMSWSGDRLILPTIPGSAASGVVICVAGLQEAVRGSLMFHPVMKRRIRPTFVLVDDPQTRASAKSEGEIISRLLTIRSDLMGMVGPDQTLSVLIPCTVIEPNDVAAQLLDREKSPEFRGVTCKMLYEWPTNLELWQEYDVIRRQCLLNSDELDENSDLSELWKPANNFYKKHRKAMDAGAQVAWEQKKLKHEISAIQHAMNIWLRDDVFFATECQNDPISILDDDDTRLDRDEMAEKLSGLDRWQVPDDCQDVTAFIDCHKNILYYVVTAWSPTFDGYIIDYGTYPPQQKQWFTQRTANPTLGMQAPGAGIEGALYKGLETLTKRLFSQNIRRDDGGRLSISLCMIDAGWKTTTVEKFCAESGLGTRVAPSIGRKIGPDEKRLSKCKARRDELIGLEWTIPGAKGRDVRQIQFDTFYWKTFFHNGLATPAGDRGSIALFGTRQEIRKRVDHSHLIRHLDSEYSTEVTGRQTVNVWRLKPGESQNHWFDSVVGTCVAASVRGCTIVGDPFERLKKQTSKRRAKRIA